MSNSSSRMASRPLPCQCGCPRQVRGKPVKWSDLTHATQFKCDARSYAAVVANAPCVAKHVVDHVSEYVSNSQRGWQKWQTCYCKRAQNVIQSILSICAISFQMRWQLPTIPGRSMFYTLRGRIKHCIDTRNDMKKGVCEDHHDKHAALDIYMPALKSWARKLQGPHCVDMPAYICLRARLGNDVACHIFSFI